MAINLVFGLPGCGKTTLLTKMVFDALKKGKYKNVYCNVPLAGDPIFDKMIMISPSDIGKYLISDGIVFLDESMIAFNTRNYAKFNDDLVQYFCMHRHYNVDLWLFSQRSDGLDKNIRSITDRVFYCSKKFPTGFWWSNIVRVPYKIIFPDAKSDRAGEIIQGYIQPPFLNRLFAQHLFRPKYYKYFNSWDRPKLPELPSVRKKRIAEYRYQQAQLNTEDSSSEQYADGAAIGQSLDE